MKRSDKTTYNIVGWRRWQTVLTAVSSLCRSSTSPMGKVSPVRTSSKTEFSLLETSTRETCPFSSVQPSSVTTGPSSATSRTRRMLQEHRPEPSSGSSSEVSRCVFIIIITGDDYICDQVARLSSRCPISRGPGLESQLCCVHTLFDSQFMLCSHCVLIGWHVSSLLSVSLCSSCPVSTQTQGFILSVCFIISLTVITLVNGQVDRCCCNSGFIPRLTLQPV